MRHVLALALMAGPAFSYEEPTSVAVDLGGILGSELACGFTLNPDAVAAYVGAQIDPANVGFANALYLMSNGTKVQIDGMSASERAAHCQAVRARAENLALTNP